MRIPKDFRFRGLEVSIRKEGEAVILEPIRKKEWPKAFWRSIRVTDPAFVRPEQGEIEERTPLDLQR